MTGTADSGSPHGLPQMNRFLETCLLLLLAEGSAHGYALLEKLPLFGFEPGELNVSTLYRTLRKMETDGQVVSEWASGDLGPPRRVYSLTDAGRAMLCCRIDMIRERRRRLERLIAEYEDRYPNDGQGPCPETRPER